MLVLKREIKLVSYLTLKIISPFYLASFEIIYIKICQRQTNFWHSLRGYVLFSWWNLLPPFLLFSQRKYNLFLDIIGRNIWTFRTEDCSTSKQKSSVHVMQLLSRVMKWMNKICILNEPLFKFYIHHYAYFETNISCFH